MDRSPYNKLKLASDEYGNNLVTSSVLFDTGAPKCLIRLDIAIQLQVFSNDQIIEEVTFTDNCNNILKTYGKVDFYLMLNLQDTTDGKSMAEVVPFLISAYVTPKEYPDEVVIGVNFLQENAITVFFDYETERKQFYYKNFSVINVFTIHSYNIVIKPNSSIIDGETKMSENPIDQNEWDAVPIISYNVIGDKGEETLRCKFDPHVFDTVISRSVAERLCEVRANLDGKDRIKLDLETVIDSSDHSSIIIVVDENHEMESSADILDEDLPDYDCIIGAKLMMQFGITYQDNQILLSNYENAWRL
jgi:hypothetical protein